MRLSGRSGAVSPALRAWVGLAWSHSCSIVLQKAVALLRQAWKVKLL